MKASSFQAKSIQSTTMRLSLDPEAIKYFHIFSSLLLLSLKQLIYLLRMRCDWQDTKNHAIGIVYTYRPLIVWRIGFVQPFITALFNLLSELALAGRHEWLDQGRKWDEKERGESHEVWNLCKQMDRWYPDTDMASKWADWWNMESTDSSWVSPPSLQRSQGIDWTRSNWWRDDQSQGRQWIYALPNAIESMVEWVLVCSN